METKEDEERNVYVIKATMNELKNGVELSIESPNEIIIIPDENKQSK